MVASRSVTCPECGKTWEIPGARIKPKIHCSCGAVFKPHGHSGSPTLGSRPEYRTVQLLVLVFGALGAIGIVSAIGTAVYSFTLEADSDEAWDFAFKWCGALGFGGLMLVAISQLFKLFLDIAAYVWEMTNTLRQIKLTGAGATADRPAPSKPVKPKILQQRNHNDGAH